MSSDKDREKEKNKGRSSGASSGSPSDTGGSEEFDFSTSGQIEEPGSFAEQIQKLVAEKQDLMNTMVRRQADFENYRKRVEKERQQERHRGVEALIEGILPVLDAFDRALAGLDESASSEYRRGFELISRQLWDALSKQGLNRIESVGKEFNPHFHHAIEQVETAEHPEGTVMDELQPGYVFHERVLRPAMVRVATELQPKSTSVSHRE